MGAGTVTITVSAAEGTNYLAAESKTISVTVKRIPGNITLNKTSENITYGTASTTLTVSSHHGGTLTAVQSGTNVSGVTTNISGNNITISGLGNKNAGTQVTIRVASGQTSVYESAYQDYTLTIIKKKPTITLASTSKEINALSNTTVTYTYDGDGVVSVVSNNTNIVTTSINTSTKTITINGVGAGTATITVSAAEGTNYLAADNKTISVTVKRIPGNISLNKSKIDVTYGTASTNITVSNHHGGTLSAVQRGTNVEGITTNIVDSIVTVGGLSGKIRC